MKVSKIFVFAILQLYSFKGMAEIPEECKQYVGVEERANLAFIYPKIIVKAGCPACHSPGGSFLELDTAEKFRTNMIDVKAKNFVAGENGWTLIKPMDYMNSFLIRKLELPGEGEGDPMPTSAQKINDPFLCVIKTWIANGATN